METKIDFQFLSKFMGLLKAIVARFYGHLGIVMLSQQQQRISGKQTEQKYKKQFYINICIYMYMHIYCMDICTIHIYVCM